MTDHEMIINKVYIKKKSKTVIGFISEESLKIGTVVKIVYKEETKYFEILSKTIDFFGGYMYEAMAFGYGEDILKDCDHDIINQKLSIESNEETIKSLIQRSLFC